MWDEGPRDSRPSPVRSDIERVLQGKTRPSRPKMGLSAVGGVTLIGTVKSVVVEVSCQIVFFFFFFSRKGSLTLAQSKSK